MNWSGRKFPASFLHTEKTRVCYLNEMEKGVKELRPPRQGLKRQRAVDPKTYRPLPPCPRLASSLFSEHIGDSSP